MSAQEQDINVTIANLIAELKPRTSTKAFDDVTPIKRTSGSEDAPSTKKLKRDDSADFTYIGSPREIRRIRCDLVYARNTISSLENRIQHMHNVRKQMQIMFDNETQSLKSQHERDRKSIEELESQLQSIRKRELELQDELAEMNNKCGVLKIESDKRVEELEKELCDLTTDIEIQTEEEKQEIAALKSKVSELESLCKAAEDDAEAQKKLAEELDKRLQEHNKEHYDLEIKNQEIQKLKLQLKELEYIKETYAEIQQQAKTQQHKLSTYGDLEKENQRLREELKQVRDEVHNKLILEEEVYDLKTRLANHKEQEKKLTVLQTVQAQNEMYLEEWRSVARGICETSGPDSSLAQQLRSLVEHLQQQEINLTSEKMQLSSQLNTALHEAKVAKGELEKGQKLIAELQTNMQQRQSLIHRMQKKLLLISRERDSYRKQLDSYEHDLTICLNPASSAQPGMNQIQTQRDRIESLERIVEGYREMVTKLENDLQSNDPSNQLDAIPVKVGQANRLQDEIDRLKHENSLLRERKDQLEIRLEDLLVGQDDAQGGRIVHATNNPLSECIAQKISENEKLAEEVEKLRRKIRKLEEGLEASKLGDTSICSKDVQALKDQVKSSETQIQRLKEYFKSSMQEFRNVIYMLLGYKIDKHSNSQYKLTSMYAERPEDQICFQLDGEGALHLLESQFTSTLDEFVELHLHHQKSIPVFLSAITLDLFNSKTMTKTFAVEDD